MQDVSPTPVWIDPFVAIPEPAAPIGGPLDVLVVEDSVPARRALELSLGHLGHRVFSAISLRQARGLLAAFALDVMRDAIARG